MATPCRESVCVGGEEWSLGQVLGRGGFATVYAGTAHATGRRAAVKIIDLSVQSPWADAKLRTEGENLHRAQRHQNVIELFGEARLGQYHVFVMEAWGRDLLEPVLEQRGLGEEYSQGVMVQLMRALAWLHEKRICHGDVKPENLLCATVDGVDVVKLADFGSAIQLPPSGVAAVDPVAQGTTLYSPPEVLHGHAYTCKADIWAAGITAYVLITGYFPFGSAADAISSSASFGSNSWRPVSMRAREFIQDLLDDEPSSRPTAEESLSHAWVAEFDGEGETPPESPRLATPAMHSSHAYSSLSSSSSSPPLVTLHTPTTNQKRKASLSRAAAPCTSGDATRSAPLPTARPTFDETMHSPPKKRLRQQAKLATAQEAKLASSSSEASSSRVVGEAEAGKPISPRCDDAARHRQGSTSSSAAAPAVSVGASTASATSTVSPATFAATTSTTSLPSHEHMTIVTLPSST